MINSRQIEQFQGDNFHNWKYRVQNLLAEYDVLDCIKSEACQKLLNKKDEKSSQKGC